MVEFMVSTTLSLILLSTLLAMVAPGIAALAKIKSSTDLQDSGRIAVEHLRDAISFAGYQGCRPDTSLTSVLTPTQGRVSPRLEQWAYDKFGLVGFDSDENQRISETIGISWRNQRYQYEGHEVGDLLLVQTAGNEALVVEEHIPQQFQLVFQGRKTDQLKPGKIIQLNDCEHAARLQISMDTRPVYSTVSDTTTVFYSPAETVNCHDSSVDVLSLGPDAGNCTNLDTNSEDLFRFRRGTHAHSVESAAYYIGYDSASAAPALKRSGFATNAARVYTETLIEGIENMRLRYAIDTDSDGQPDHHLSASELHAGNASDSRINWSNVIQVQLWLLTRSLEKTMDTPDQGAVLFPAPNGRWTDCNETPAATDRDYISHLHACPFSRFGKKQYARKIVNHVIPIHGAVQ